MKKVKFLNLQNKKNSLPLLDGREITGGEVFEASLSDIPEAYRDRVQIVATIENNVVEEKEEKENSIEVEKPEIPEKVEKEETTVTEEVENPTVTEEVEKPTVEDVKEMNFTPPFKKDHKGFGKYVVLDSKGNVVEENVTSIKADQILKQMKAGV